MNPRWLMIMQQIDPPTDRPFRIVEQYFTSDGVRTRIAEGVWKTLAEAEANKAQRLENEPNART